MDIKKFTTRPGFEFIFAAGIAAIFIIPSAVMAQSNKSIDISITNGDTVVNGKNIKELNPQQREDALKDLNTIKSGPRGGRREIRIERRMDKGMGIGDQAMLPPPLPDAPQYGDYVGGNKDKPLRLKRRLTDTSSAYTYTFRFNDGNHTLTAPRIDEPAPPMNDGMRPMDMLRDRGRLRIINRRRNTQSFNYSNTDARGVSTTIGYRVTDGRGENDTDGKTDLSLTDLKLIADFTTGKTTLTFSFPAKGTIVVNFINTDGNTLWSERITSGSFSKTFAMTLNGRYQLQVKQGNKEAIKDIFKEQ